ncbi:MAG: DUF2269 domain-containing protein [Gammaproteobacteria bacterium]
MALKLVHIISSTLLFGAGLGTAFYMWRADRSRDLTVIAAVSRHVVIADWLFTAPAVIIQPLTGLAMLHLAQIPLTTPWVIASLVLYGVTGLCWLPVVYLQIQVCRNARRLLQNSEELNAAHDRYMKCWYLLGWPAFISVLLIFYLMVFKPAFG